MKQNFSMGIILLIAVMMATTGIAAATDAAMMDGSGTNPAPTNINLNQGDSVGLNVKVYNLVPENNVPVSARVIPLDGGNAADLQISGLPAKVSLVTDPTLLPFEVKNVAAPVGKNYRVTVQVGSDEPATINFAAASRNFNSVPEFPTVVLPVAAVIGMVFLFKKKKE